MNILYLHGLESKLNQPKREILERYGLVFAPDLDYKKDPASIERILLEYSGANISVVIGSSMGGFAGYYVSSALKCPALLFNPALKHRSVEQHIPPVKEDAQSHKRIVLGLQDEVVDPSHTLNFIAENLYKKAGLSIILRPEMEHRVELNIFEEELEQFFKRVTNRNSEGTFL